ncbi:hypothetical protein KPG71_18805 [Roseovarius sp. PS-C2]|uniref:transcription termination/antitermination protein NusG n=1 Tax=Roseovarius sp. PS-C2 TaxID=2820814 RepID=UPI001C0B793D|nr:transcription termination/antitermination NusG family protein [Roseovarius sp. PS-C2]MBU3262076.1 hypothetical protein [Roseovarius sp. PS-C2]
MKQGQIIEKDGVRFGDLRIGDVVQGSKRAMFAEPLDRPVWNILRCAPQKELAAIAWLRVKGVEGAFCPTEECWRRLPSGPRRKVKYDRPVAPGYVFALFERRPVWHHLFEASRGKLTKVITLGGEPLDVPESKIMDMKRVPGRIEALRRKAKERAIIRKGDRVEVTDGPLAGWSVDVSRIDAGLAWFVVPLLGEREVSVPVDRVRKLGS